MRATFCELYPGVPAGRGPDSSSGDILDSSVTITSNRRAWFKEGGTGKHVAPWWLLPGTGTGNCAEKETALSSGQCQHRCGGKGARLSDIQWLLQRSKCACVRGV